MFFLIMKMFFSIMKLTRPSMKRLFSVREPASFVVFPFERFMKNNCIIINQNYRYGKPENRIRVEYPFLFWRI